MTTGIHQHVQQDKQQAERHGTGLNYRHVTRKNGVHQSVTDPRPRKQGFHHHHAFHQPDKLHAKPRQHRRAQITQAVTQQQARG